MLSVKFCTVPESVVNNYRGSTRGFYFPQGQILFFHNQLVVVVWIDKQLYFSAIETYIQDGRPEYVAVVDDVATNSPMRYVVGSIPDILYTGKRVTSGT